jgi:hypothetical protein
VVSETSTVTVCPAWMRLRAAFCPATMITPVAEARRWTRISSAEGHGSGDGRPGTAQPGDVGCGA